MRTSPSPYVRDLKAVPLFAGCTPAELARVAALTTGVHVAAGKVLCTEGTVGREFFIVEAGEASVSVDGHEVATLGAGSFFGEIALLSHAPRTATVTAVTPMQVLVLTPAEFHGLVALSPAIAKNVQEAMDTRVAETQHLRSAA
jgi:CRP-like cAMP-binding protein